MKPGEYRYFQFVGGPGRKQPPAVPVKQYKQYFSYPYIRTNGYGERHRYISDGDKHENPLRRVVRFKHRQPSSAMTVCIILSALIFCITGALSTIDGYSLPSAGRPNGILGSTVRDTTQRSGVSIPLGISTGLSSRPRFETVHMALGFGLMFSDFSDLKKVGVDKSNLTLPFSLYIHIPFHREDPTLYLLGGWDLSTNITFKTMLMLQTDFRLLFGLGFGRTSSSHRSDEGNRVNFEASQSYGLLALGVNLSPGILDLILFMPLGSSLTTEFENSRYSVRLSGVNVSLVLSLR